MKYTVIPGVILTKICDEDFLVATGPAAASLMLRGSIPPVLTFSQKFLMGFPQKKL